MAMRTLARSITVPALLLASLAVALPIHASAPQDATSRKVPRTAADSLAAACESLFFTAQYDFMLRLAGAFLQRAESSGDSVLLQ